MKIIENKSSYKIEELINMAKRENNKKRSFLIVNPSQAKHMPVQASQTLKLFKELSAELKKYVSEEDNILFIGFAETATAIGAGVASEFPDSFYMHTTREIVDNANMIVEFKELHSHATQQTLQCNDWENIINGKNHIIFVEDEISTGTTIMNFVNALKENKKVPENMKFSVCSIINGMTEERKKELEKQNVFFIYLLKISMAGHEGIEYNSPAVTLNKQENCHKNISHININKDYMNARTGVNTRDYINAVDNISETILDKLSDYKIEDEDKIAVIGSEEFMYPAILTAYKIENAYKSCQVVTHSTTRSPAEPHNEENYPLKSRASIDSFYEHNRNTFLYNTYHNYKLVILITDSTTDNPCAEKSFTDAFTECENFIIVRWN